VITEEEGRSVIHCDRCPARLDLGAAAIVQPRLRMPSGWLVGGPDVHLCSMCSRKEIEGMTSNLPA
jgi:hypothetical protein